MQELRRKHEVAQVAVAEEEAYMTDEDSEEEEDKDDTSDKAGVVKILRKVHTPFGGTMWTGPQQRIYMCTPLGSD